MRLHVAFSLQQKIKIVCERYVSAGPKRSALPPPPWPELPFDRGSSWVMVCVVMLHCNIVLHGFARRYAL
jgi:hypothetical protein